MNESWNSAYENIRQRFALVVGEWVDDIACDIDALEMSSRPAGSLGLLFRKLHDLAGSSGTYGMHDVSTQAVDAVMICRRAIDRETPLTGAEFKRLREITSAMRSALMDDRANGTPTEPAVRSGHPSADDVPS